MASSSNGCYLKSSFEDRIYSERTERAKNIVYKYLNKCNDLGEKVGIVVDM